MEGLVTALLMFVGLYWAAILVVNVLKRIDRFYMENLGGKARAERALQRNWQAFIASRERRTARIAETNARKEQQREVADRTKGKLRSIFRIQTKG